MNIFTRIARGFILAFGITEPSPAKQKQATIFICSLLGGIVLVVIAMVYIFVTHGMAPD